MLKKIENTLFKYRLIIFVLIIAVFAGPIYWGIHWLSLDGAAHLYNAQLIRHLLFAEYPRLELFCQMNPEPVPNWTGHFILALFSSFLPAFVAEKILLAVYFFGFSLAFRALVLQFNPRATWAPLLSVAALYPVTFIFGFYNYSMACILFLVLLWYYLRERKKGSIHFQNGLVLFGLFLLLYFSHLMVFGLALIAICISEGSLLASQKSPNRPASWQYSLQNLGAVGLAALLPLSMGFYYYVWQRPLIGKSEFIPMEKLVNDFITTAPLIKAEPFNEQLAWRLLVVFITVLAFRFWQAFQMRDSLSPQVLRFIPKFQKQDGWIVVAILVGFLYFTLPNANGTGGYITTRLGYFALLALLIWLSAHKMRPWVWFLIILMVLKVCFLHYRQQLQNNKLDYAMVAAIKQAAQPIKPGSVVLPVNYSSHWQHGHYSNFLGIEKPLVLLENYECATGYFPVKWNSETLPKVILPRAQGTLLSKAWRTSNPKNAPMAADYVFLLKGGTYLKNADKVETIEREMRDLGYKRRVKNDFLILWEVTKE